LEEGLISTHQASIQAVTIYINFVVRRGSIRFWDHMAHGAIMIPSLHWCVGLYSITTLAALIEQGQHQLYSDGVSTSDFKFGSLYTHLAFQLNADLGKRQLICEYIAVFLCLICLESVHRSSNKVYFSGQLVFRSSCQLTGTILQVHKILHARRAVHAA
jgi:hypothetical protein